MILEHYCFLDIYIKCNTECVYLREKKQRFFPLNLIRIQGRYTLSIRILEQEILWIEQSVLLHVKTGVRNTF